LFRCGSCLILSLVLSLAASLSPLQSHAAALRVFFGTSESYALDGFVSGVCQGQEQCTGGR
jgi:hypothetical protein